MSELRPDTAKNKTNFKNFLKSNDRDFPGDPVVETLPSNAGGASLIPGWGAKGFLCINFIPCDFTKFTD